MPSHSPSPDHSPELVGSAELARLLDISQVTVSRWVKTKRLFPAHQLPGKNGAYLFDRADADKLIAERKAAESEQAS